MKRYIKRPLKFILAFGALMSGIGQAHAFSSYANDIISHCDSSGNPLLAEYANDTCGAACHNNPDGKAAYSSGNYEYFCPSVVAVEPTCTDADGDGFYAEGEVCGTPADFNDNEASAYPGATEICSDGIDNDGNGLTDTADPNAVNCPVTCTDLDGDGYSTEGGECGPIDCNDADSNINPGAQEACGDGVDNNCNGLTDTADMNAVDCPMTCTDADGDGFSVEGGACGPIDCDDSNPEVNPAALELCDDGIDNNCDGRSDANDTVCQSSDTGGDTSGSTGTEQPWWRNRAWHRNDRSHGFPVPQTQDMTSDDDESGSGTDDDAVQDDDSDGDGSHSPHKVRRVRYHD